MKINIHRQKLIFLKRNVIDFIFQIYTTCNFNYKDHIQLRYCQVKPRMQFFILIIQWRIKLSLVKKTPSLALRQLQFLLGKFKLIEFTKKVSKLLLKPLGKYIYPMTPPPPIFKNVLDSEFMVFCHMLSFDIVIVHTRAF